MGIEVDLYLNAILILAVIAGVLGIGFKAVNGNGQKKKKD